MTSTDIRKRFLAFFEARGHAILPSASLVPENDPSVLFNTAGMQPLVPYLMGQKHPLGTRLASCQKCVRTGDLEDIGDNRHFSFFEMLGNWSLGDYFKEEAITWSYEFLTSKEEGLCLDPARLAVTIFEGDENAPYDQESKDIWMSLGIPEHRIYALPADDNWWSPGDNGPCGPCSEMFYDMHGSFVGRTLTKEEFIDQVRKETIIEVWNDVFMEYEKKDGKVVGKLSQKNVDTGAGLERLTAVMQGKDTAYETDIFEGLQDIFDAFTLPLINGVENFSYIQSSRIIFDHIRTSLMMVNDGVLPANKDKGYILRRLIRRSIVHIKKYYDKDIYAPIYEIINFFLIKYSNIYIDNNDFSKNRMVILEETKKFIKTLDNALKEFDKTEFIGVIDKNEKDKKGSVSGKIVKSMSGKQAFNLIQTHGFPLEMIIEIANDKGISINLNELKDEMKKHQEISNKGAEQKFKGGLAGTSEKIVRSHTAHHLLLAALQRVLGPHVHQRGSNITEERIRIDFAHDEKMTDEQKSQVEMLVNEWIGQDIPVQHIEMERSEAEKIGAEMEFGMKYPEKVSVYFVGESLETALSKEFCGGPHVSRTGEIGNFTLAKEEASSAGIRRIKATLD